MKKTLRLLQVEDNEDDALLILKELRRGGYEPVVERVDTAATMQVALERGPWDVIISDFSLPGFSGLDALRLAKESGLDIPFILVSGTIGEDVAVGAMKVGANDYIMKSRLARLLPAVERELADAEARRKRRQAEEAKEESEARFRGAFDTSAIGMGIVAPEGRWLAVNPSLRRILGYSEEEFLKLSFQEVTHPDDLKADQEFMDRMLTGEISSYQLEKRHVNKDGGIVWGLLSVSLVRDAQNRPLHFVAQIQDITGRKHAEKLQQAVYRISEAASGARSLDDLFRAVHESIKTVMPADNFYIALYDEARDVITFPYFVDEVDPPHPPKRPGKGLTEYVLRTGAPLLCDSEANDELIRSGEVELVGAPSPIWLGVPLKIDDRTIGVMGVQHYSDERAYGTREKEMLEYVSAQVAKVIERKRSEEAQRRNEEQFRLISENVVDMIAVLDREGRRCYSSPSYKPLLGASESLVGTDSFLDIHPDDRERIKHIFSETVKTGVGQWAEYRFVSRGGAIRYIESQGSVIRDEHGDVARVLVVSRDVTEKRQLERQFFRAQRMESIGTLAGGIAHDLNNVLSPIMLSVDLLKKKLPDEQSQKTLRMLHAAGKRGADLIKQVLSFARGVDGERTTIQVGHLLEETAKIIKETFPKSISFTMDVPRSLPAVSADATQIHQVLMNLCVNARDAMPNGGTITLKAEAVTLDDQYVQGQAEAKPGRYVVMSVTDQGVGIPPEVQDRIFDPFFTTKELGSGTGLGLSTVLAIVRSHGGFIAVYSEVGRGATFKVALPVAEGAAAEHPDQEAVLQTGTGELILVVDDEPMIREITRSTLELNGYSVITAADGAEALALYAGASGQVALVVTDMMMPHMDGASTIRVLQKLNPKVKILAVSGLNQERVNLKERTVAFLQKPYTTERLLAAIAELLSQE